MIATQDNLNDIARLARKAQAQGAKTIEFEIGATCGFAKYVWLWENTTGVVVGRIFGESGGVEIPGIPRPRTVRYFKVRADVITVLEAQRRRTEAETREFGNIP